MSSKKEYCCTQCGLIWFDENSILNKIICPECNNYFGKDLYNPIFHCNSSGWFHSCLNVLVRLRSEGKEIHYHEEHPLYKYVNKKIE